MFPLQASQGGNAEAAGQAIASALTSGNGAQAQVYAAALAQATASGCGAVANALAREGHGTGSCGWLLYLVV